MGLVRRDGDYFTPIIKSDITERVKSRGLVRGYSSHQPFTAETFHKFFKPPSAKPPRR